MAASAGWVAAARTAPLRFAFLLAGVGRSYLVPVVGVPRPPCRARPNAVAPGSLEVRRSRTVAMAMDVYLATRDGTPEPASAIAALAWYREGAPFAGRLAP